MINDRTIFGRLGAGLLGALGVSLLLIGSAFAEDPEPWVEPDPEAYAGPCDVYVAIVTCHGADTLPGVNVGNVLDINTLVVNGLIGDIVPEEGTAGVVFDTTQAATAIVDLGDYKITTSGTAGTGIYISARGEYTDAALTLTGDVESADAAGVVVVGSGSATSNTTGGISAFDQALYVKGAGGAVDLDHTGGDITSSMGGGVMVEAMGGSDIAITGNIDSYGTAVDSHSYDSGLTHVVIDGNVTSTQGSGLYIAEDNSTANIEVTGDIAAYVDGIAVKAMGDITIDQTGQLTTDSGTGIYAQSSTGGVDITHDGGIIRTTGDSIVADAHGSGSAVTIDNTGSITSDEGNGVWATTSEGSVDITLDGTTTAQLDAIHAEAHGGGAVGVDIDSNDAVVSYEGNGIYATSTGTGMNADGQWFGVRINQSGSVTAQLDAITATASQGNVIVRVDQGGGVTSYEGTGIAASTGSGTVGINVDGGVTAKGDAVTARADTGDVTVEIGEGVNSDEGRGVFATTDGGNVDVTVHGSVTGFGDAVTAQTDDGTVVVDVGGFVVSNDGKGVYAASDTGSVSVTVDGDVTAQTDAIVANSQGGNSGTVSVNVGGSVLANDGKGVSATAANGGVTVDIDGSVTAQDDAIVATTTGGDLSSTVSVDVNGVTSYSGRGIVGEATTQGVTIHNTGELTSELDGIVATSTGAGEASAVSVTQDEKLTSYTGAGIQASSTGGKVTVSTGNGVEADLDAIVADTQGAGTDATVEITNAWGDIVSNKGRGIVATATDQGITIDNAGSVSADLDGIIAKTTGGAADVSVTTGYVKSYKGVGIEATSTGGKVTVTTHDGGVDADLDAVTATSGDNAITVDIDGKVTSQNGTGIVATTLRGDVGVSADDVSSKFDAVTATTSTGVVAVDVGAVTSTDGQGIIASSLNGKVDVTAGEVDAMLDAITLYTPSGAITLHAGDVNSAEGKGVTASNLNSGMIDLTTGDIDTALDAISASSLSGSIKITTGSVNSGDGRGIVADAVYSGTVTILAGTVEVPADVSAALDAITAKAYSNISVTTGDVTSGDGKGVDAFSANGGVTLKLGDVESEANAISVDARSTTGITAGDITSRSGAGIYAVTTEGAITVNVGDVQSHDDGVYADAGNNAVQITTGDVTSTDGKGIYANADRGAVTIVAGDVSSFEDAIWAGAYTGNTSVTADDVESETGRGVYATTGNGTLGVDVASVTSALDAITARSTGASNSGTVTVKASGDIRSTEGKAIVADAVNGKVDIDTEGDVRGLLDAIVAHAENNEVKINVAGDVTSDNKTAIDASSALGNVDVTVGGNVTAKLNGIVIQADSGTAKLEVTGTVTSYDGKAVVLTSDTASATVVIDGAVTAKLDAITAKSTGVGTGANVSVTTGNGITSYDGRGIVAEAADQAVIIDSTGAVTTKLTGIVAKSTGDDAAASVSVTQDGKLTSYSAAGIDAYSAGGPVVVNASGGIETDLDGIIAKSAGAGLISSVKVINDGTITSWKGVGINASSTGGPVTIETAGNINADLDGIVAKSLGDDGASAVSVTNSNGKIVSQKGSGIVATSTREGVTVDNTGDIVADVDGIHVESTGTTETSVIDIDQNGNIVAAKGRGIYAKGQMGVDIDVAGNITGDGTYGIHATSLDQGVTVDVAAGSTIAGSSSAGVYLNAFTTATLTNRGDISSAWGRAFEFAGLGTGTVNNYGTISGDFAFTGAAGTFNNYAGATYNAGTNMEFMFGGIFNNSGTLSLSTGLTSSTIGVSYLSGNYSQSSTGRLYADLNNVNGTSDLLAVTGTATLSGKVTANVVGDIGSSILGDYTILSAAEGLTLDGIKLSNPTLYGTVLSANGTDAVLRVSSVNFAPTGVASTVVNTGTYIENIFTNGTPDAMKPLLQALVNTPDMETYEQALSQLTPEQYSQEVQNTYGSNLAFSNRLLSCRVPEGENKFKAEGDCDWFGTRFSKLDQDETDQQAAFDQTFATLEAGSQRRLDDTWRLGGAIGVTTSVMSEANGSSVEATQAQAGIVVKYDSQSLLLASTLTAGYGMHDSTRNVTIGNIDDTLEGSAPIAYVSTRLHAAYTFDMGTAYVKPLFNLDLTATNFGGVTEVGGSTALTIAGGTQYGATFNPAVEIGGEFDAGEGKKVRPFAQFGLEATIASDLELAARFTNVDPSIGSFTITQPDAEPVAKLSLGADVFTADKATIRVYYDGAFGATSRKNGIGLKMSSQLD